MYQTVIVEDEPSISQLHKAFLARDPMAQSGVLSFQLEDMDCEQAGEQLGEAGFALRAGLHCAPLAHKSAGTLDRGTIRASLSVFNTHREVERFLRAVASLSQERKY